MKNIILKTLYKIGYTVLKNDHPKLEKPGAKEERILTYLIEDQSPTCFDVGAHVGETIDKFSAFFPNGKIWAFEPTYRLFNNLLLKYGDVNNLRIENFALSDFHAEANFYLQDHENFNSLNKMKDGKNKTEKVTVTTLDSYCSQNDIKEIDVLKIDTQGNDSQVLKGSKNILQNTKVVMTEITFADTYGHRTSFLDIEKALPKEFILYDIIKKVNVKHVDHKHMPQSEPLIIRNKHMKGHLLWSNVVYINTKYFK